MACSIIRKGTLLATIPVTIKSSTNPILQATVGHGVMMISVYENAAVFKTFGTPKPILFAKNNHQPKRGETVFVVSDDIEEVKFEISAHQFIGQPFDVLLFDGLHIFWRQSQNMRNGGLDCLRHHDYDSD